MLITDNVFSILSFAISSPSLFEISGKLFPLSSHHSWIVSFKLMVEVNVEWNIKSFRILFIVYQRLRHSPNEMAFRTNQLISDWPFATHSVILISPLIFFHSCRFIRCRPFAEIHRKKWHCYLDHVALQLVVGSMDDECWFLLTISNLYYIDFSSIFDLLPKLVLIANVIKSSFLWLMLSVSCSARDKSIRCTLLSHGRLFGLCESVRACIVF